LLAGGFLVAYNFFYTQSVTKMAESKELKPVVLRGDLDWAVTGVDGTTLDLQSLDGDVIFLHLWRPECVSCVAEIPGVNALYQAFASRGVAFVSIALDTDDTLAGALSVHDVQFPVYTLGDTKLPAMFEAHATPTTFILDSAGFIVYQHAGAVEWDTPDARAFLERLAGN